MKKQFSATDAQLRCKRYRKRILDVSQTVSALHIAPAFSCLEMIDCAYHGLMTNWRTEEEGDRFIISKGHGSMALYSVLEDLGVMPKEYVDHYSKPGWPLSTHPDYGNPGIHASTGSLGHGLGLAVGMGYADLMDQKDRSLYLVLSDGELMEGSVWEAIMLAPSLGIKNLVIMIDSNDFISLGRPSEMLSNFYPLEEKFQAFGWEVKTVNGHDSEAIFQTVEGRSGTKPFALIGKTIKGKGVSYMENIPLWHYRSPNQEEYQQALKEIENS